LDGEPGLFEIFAIAFLLVERDLDLSVDIEGAEVSGGDGGFECGEEAEAIFEASGGDGDLGGSGFGESAFGVFDGESSAEGFGEGGGGFAFVVCGCSEAAELAGVGVGKFGCGAEFGEFGDV
jgi:hypothetical protein